MSIIKKQYFYASGAGSGGKLGGLQRPGGGGVAKEWGKNGIDTLEIFCCSCSKLSSVTTEKSLLCGKSGCLDIILNLSVGQSVREKVK